MGSIEEKRLGIRVMPWLIVKIDWGGFGVVLCDPFRVVVCTGDCLVLICDPFRVKKVSS